MTGIEKMTKAISGAEEELREIDSEIDPLAAETRSALGRVTADLLSGVIDDAKAAKLREQAERELQRIGDRRETLRAALPELRARLAAEQEAERRARAEKLRAEARQAIDNREKALRRFGACTRETVSAAREVERHRKLTDDAVSALGGVLAEGEELDLSLDEDWPEQTSELFAVLQAGPRRPQAERERKAAEAATVAAVQDAEILSWFAQRPSASRLEQVPEYLRRKADEILAEHGVANEAEQERLRAQAESREPLRI